MTNWNILDVETYFSNCGIHITDDKPEIDPDCAIYNIFPDEDAEYEVFVNFEGHENIQSLWHAYSLVINAYMCSKEGVTLCGFLEDDHFGNFDITDLKPFYNKWLSEDEAIVSFRYWVTVGSGEDILYLKIVEAEKNQIDLHFISKNKNDSLNTVRLKLPESFKIFENFILMAGEIDSKLGELIKFYRGLRQNIDPFTVPFPAPPPPLQPPPPIQNPNHFRLGVVQQSPVYSPQSRLQSISPTPPQNLANSLSRNPQNILTKNIGTSGTAQTSANRGRDFRALSFRPSTTTNSVTDFNLPRTPTDVRNGSFYRRPSPTRRRREGSSPRAAKLYTPPSMFDINTSRDRTQTRQRSRSRRSRRRSRGSRRGSRSRRRQSMDRRRNRRRSFSSSSSSSSSSSNSSRSRPKSTRKSRSRQKDQTDTLNSLSKSINNTSMFSNSTKNTDKKNNALNILHGNAYSSLDSASQAKLNAFTFTRPPDYYQKWTKDIRTAVSRAESSYTSRDSKEYLRDRKSFNSSNYRTLKYSRQE